MSLPSMDASEMLSSALSIVIVLALGPNPNAALINIGAALTASDGVFQQCALARGSKQTK
jgi:hypothetical protein